MLGKSFQVTVLYRMPQNFKWVCALIEQWQLWGFFQRRQIRTVVQHDFKHKDVNNNKDYKGSKV